MLVQCGFVFVSHGFLFLLQTLVISLLSIMKFGLSVAPKKKKKGTHHIRGEVETLPVLYNAPPHASVHDRQ